VDLNNDIVKNNRKTPNITKLSIYNITKYSNITKYHKPWFIFI